MIALLLAAVLANPLDLPCRLRDKDGHLIRSSSRRDQFVRMSGGRRAGMVVDHIQPLCAGGCDLVGNFQWQTEADARVKDRWEYAYCAGRTTLSWAEWYLKERCEKPKGRSRSSVGKGGQE